ncbi:MAG: NAD(+) diphosphatase [Kangiellaceae bacterium]|nr:NAD(+) diphosphatase [Kangiellaceae bacterium]
MFALQFDGLNRQGELRPDSQAIEALINLAETRFLPVFQQQLACFNATQSTEQTNHADDADNKKSYQLQWLTKQQLLSHVEKIEAKHLIYLGKVEQQPFFSYRLQSPSASLIANQNTEWLGLRQLFKQLEPQQAYLANVAIAIEHWHNTHQHCGYCGQPTFAQDSGFVRTCSNKDCAKQHFPRTDAAVICAITYQDQILLGRQANWPENRWSVIAGFVEPGESLEQAVAREALEEAGVTVNNIKYFASQPWPFPQSLMVGFTAEAQNEQITLKDQELEQARWFSREEVNNLVQQQKLLLPFRYSISRALVENWRNSGY